MTGCAQVHFEVAGLRRELAAATTADEHNRIKEEKPVTAATTDIVAAALKRFMGTGVDIPKKLEERAMLLITAVRSS